MTDAGSAAALELERLQERSLEKTGQSPVADADARRIGELVLDRWHDVLPAHGAADAAARDAMNRALSSRPTRFEDPFSYSLLVSLADQVEATAQKLGLSLPTRPIFGTLPLGQFNAVAMRLGDPPEYVIAFHRGAIGFVTLLSKAIGASFPPAGSRTADKTSFITEARAVEAHLDRNSRAVHRFRQFLDAYVLKGHPHAAPPYLLEEPFASISALLAKSANLFILGHEYAHLIHGHLDANAVARRVLNGVDVDVVRRRWEQELEADLLGMKLAVSAMTLTHRVPFDVSYFGVDFVFSAMEVVDRAITALGGRAPSSAAQETHPAPHVRREVLRSSLAELTDPKAASAAVGLSSDVASALDSLWRRSAPHYERLRQKGIMPSSIWLS